MCADHKRAMVRAQQGWAWHVGGGRDAGVCLFMNRPRKRLEAEEKVMCSIDGAAMAWCLAMSSGVTHITNNELKVCNS